MSGPPLDGLPGGPALESRPPERIVAQVTVNFIARGREVTPQILSFVPPAARRPVGEILERIGRELRESASPIIAPS